MRGREEQSSRWELVSRQRDGGGGSFHSFTCTRACDSGARRRRELWCAIAHLRIHRAAGMLGGMDSARSFHSRPGMTGEAASEVCSLSHWERDGLT